MGHKLDYLLYSAPNVPDKIKWACSKCGQSWYTKGDERQKKCKGCGNKETILTDPLIMGGLYCWVTAFREQGGIGTMRVENRKEELEKFDVVHVNVTPGHYPYLLSLRKELGDSSSTLLVANVDYATSMWSNVDPLQLRNVLEKADLVFHVESHGARRVTKLIEREVPTIPHPVDVQRIKKLRTQPSYPPVVTCQFHRYWGTWSPYYYATMKLRKKYVMRTMLTNVWADSPIKVSLESMFDECVGNVDYFQFMSKVMAPAFANIDVTPDLTFGRGVVEAAALGIPTITSESVEAGWRLFPELEVSGSEDDSAIEGNLERLLTDARFAKEMSDQGTERCEWYGTKPSYERMRKEIDKCLDRKK